MNKIIFLFFFVFFIPLVSGFHGSSASYELWGSTNYGSDYLNGSSYSVITSLTDQPCDHSTSSSYELVLCYDFMQNKEPLPVVLSANPTSGCAPLTVDFNALIVDDSLQGLCNAGPFYVSFDFGDNSSSNLEHDNPALRQYFASHNYNNTGSFTARAVATSSYCNRSGSDEVLITIDQNCADPLEVSLSADPILGCVPLDVDFTAEVQKFYGDSLLYWFYPLGISFWSPDERWSANTTETWTRTYHSNMSNEVSVSVWEYLEGSFTGRSDHDEVRITVVVRDVNAGIEPDSDEAFLNNEVTFTGSSNECVQAYSWNVDDGTECTCDGELGACNIGIVNGSNIQPLDIECSSGGVRDINFTAYHLGGNPPQASAIANFNVLFNNVPDVNARGPYGGNVNVDIAVSGYAIEVDAGDSIQSLEWDLSSTDCILVGEITNLEGQYADNNATIQCSSYGIKSIQLKAKDSAQEENTDSADVYVSGEETNVISIDDLKITPSARQPPSDVTANVVIKNLVPVDVTVDITFSITDEGGDIPPGLDVITLEDIVIPVGGTAEPSAVFEDQKDLIDLASGIYYIKVRVDLDPILNVVEEEYFVDNERRETWVNLKQKKMVAVPETNYLAVLIVLLSVISIIYYKRRK
ncbi:MAG: hypothetical protein ABIE23_00105 [archaeon]|nr:hypothetical protein [Candidatus Micrarchaeota archaeon]